MYERIVSGFPWMDIGIPAKADPRKKPDAK
jgi:hypothetical protein